MAQYINKDTYVGDTGKQLKDLLNGDTLPIGAIVDFDGSTIPDGYARYIDPNVMSETILFDTNIWDSMMKRYETKNIDFTPYTYAEVHFTGQGGTNSTNTILKIDLTKPFKSVITNSNVSYSYGASICYPDIQLLQGSNNDPGIFRIGACISTDKTKIWMGDPGYFTGQTNSGNFDANSAYNRISKIVGFKPTIRIKKTQQPSDYPSNQIHDAYNTSTTDTYSCNYINGIDENANNLKPVELYSYTGTNKQTSITLNDSYSNYKFIEIYGQRDAMYGSVKMNTNISRVIDFNIVGQNNGYIEISSSHMTFNNTSVTLTGNVITFDTTSGAVAGYDYNQQNIIRKIYGYKE